MLNNYKYSRLFLSLFLLIPIFDFKAYSININLPISSSNWTTSASPQSGILDVTLEKVLNNPTDGDYLRMTALIEALSLIIFPPLVNS